jgi:hypothetical protein
VDLFAPRIKTSIASLRAPTGLPARIAVFNGEANGVTLDIPADDGGTLAPRRPGLGYVFGGMPRYGAGEYPVVEVAVPDAAIENLSLAHVEGDLDSSLVVSVWAGRTSGEDFPELYEKVLGYTRCITEVLLEPDAIYAREVVERIRFAFAANPNSRDRDEMETFTFGGFLFFTTQGVAQRP